MEARVVIPLAAEDIWSELEEQTYRVRSILRKVIIGDERGIYTVIQSRPAVICCLEDSEVEALPKKQNSYLVF